MAKKIIEEVAVIGLGLEGKDLVKYLQSQKVNITVFDQKEIEALDTNGINIKNIQFVCGENYLDYDFSKFKTIYRSPGLYRYHKALTKAEAKGVEISSAIKLFFQKCPAKIVGVTGTKGKGTTSTLIYEILKKDNFDTYIAGNIGKPYLELLPKLDSSSIVVMELSSFQLIDLNQSPNVSVVLNITSDHLDWHKDREEYVFAKKNIVAHQNKNDFAVINYDYNDSKKFDLITKANIVYFSRKNEVKGCYVKDNKIVLKKDINRIEIGHTSKLLLRGEHNWENVTAAVIASSCLGATIQSIRNVIFDFKGLEHRLELVATNNGVSYYNDSFSTNPQPTMAAIDSFTEPLVLILGGSDKGLDYDEMAKHIKKSGNVKAIILIGQIADKIYDSLVNADYKGKIINLKMTNMQEVVTLCKKEATSGDVVLLSPASASFGMFSDYKDRGNQFKNQINKLV